MTSSIDESLRSSATVAGLGDIKSLRWALAASIFRSAQAADFNNREIFGHAKIGFADLSAADDTDTHGLRHLELLVGVGRYSTGAWDAKRRREDDGFNT